MLHRSLEIASSEVAPFAFTSLGVSCSSSVLLQALNILTILSSVLFITILVSDIIQVGLSVYDLVKKKSQRKKYLIDEALNVTLHSICFVTALSTIVIALSMGVTIVSLLPVMMPIIFGLKALTLLVKVIKGWMDFVKSCNQNKTYSVVKKNEKLTHLIIKSALTLSLSGVAVGVLLLQTYPLLLLVMASLSLSILVGALVFKRCVSSGRFPDKRIAVKSTLFFEENVSRTQPATATVQA